MVDWGVRCPNCGEIVGYDDEKCPHCRAQLLPLPPNGFGPDGRPHWGPQQVRTPRGIKPGEVFVMVTGPDQHREPITVLSKIRTDHTVGYRFFEYQDSRFNLKRRAFLPDNGVVPYQGGHWNRTNHLLRTGRRVDISKLDLGD